MCNEQRLTDDGDKREIQKGPEKPRYRVQSGSSPELRIQTEADKKR